MPAYGLHKASLDVKQGFAYISENKNIQQEEQLSTLSRALIEKEIQDKANLLLLDSLKHAALTSLQVYQELKAQYPSITSAIIQPASLFTDSSSKATYVVFLDNDIRIPYRDKQRMVNWLKVRLQVDSLTLVIKK